MKDLENTIKETMLSEASLDYKYDTSIRFEFDTFSATLSVHVYEEYGIGSKKDDRVGVRLTLGQKNYVTYIEGLTFDGMMELSKTDKKAYDAAEKQIKDKMQSVLATIGKDVKKEMDAFDKKIAASLKKNGFTPQT